MNREGQEGYALVAAVASIAVFSAMALTVMAATGSRVEEVAAEEAQLRINAAADAGIALAINKLASPDAAQRWSIDGRTRQLSFGDAHLRIKVEDERGKIPISRLDEKLANRLLEEVGLEGERLLIARDSLLDWTDGDDDPRPFGAEAPYYAAAHIRPPNGFLASVEELGSIRGFDAKLVERIRPIVTTYTGTSKFDPTYANPIAITVMAEGSGPGSPIAIDRSRELAGQRTAIEFTDATPIAGRPLTITVEATLPDNVRKIRRVVVELPDRPDRADRPYVIRASD
ncbi:MAG: general secretion pathway protein GspK [Sphingobium sp.]|nr:general secretion pathway protein GspK [Sphingobium sp.]